MPCTNVVKCAKLTVLLYYFYKSFSIFPLSPKYIIHSVCINQNNHSINTLLTKHIQQEIRWHLSFKKNIIHVNHADDIIPHVHHFLHKRITSKNMGAGHPA